MSDKELDNLHIHLSFGGNGIAIVIKFTSLNMKYVFYVK